MNKIVQNLARRVLDGFELERLEIDNLVAVSRNDLDDMLYWANEIRKHFFANRVQVCSIVPGRLGGCSEDCAFCAQSSRYQTAVEGVRYTSDEEILEAARRAHESGVRHFGIVNSGKRTDDEELARMIVLAAEIREQYDIGLCGAFGIINDAQAAHLRKAGMSRYNHNLETSAGHFGRIVSTHEYADRVRTIEAARHAGLKVCAGGIFGIGESDRDRVDMALELRRLNVDMVPMNFLHPIEGTPLGQTVPLAPREILRIIALYRFILPRTQLKVAGGRVLNLRDLQSWIFTAGCTSIITGNYLTTAGRHVEEDMQMLADLGLEPV